MNVLDILLIISFAISALFIIFYSLSIFKLWKKKRNCKRDDAILHLYFQPFIMILFSAIMTFYIIPTFAGLNGQDSMLGMLFIGLLSLKFIYMAFTYRSWVKYTSTGHEKELLGFLAFFCSSTLYSWRTIFINKYSGFDTYLVSLLPRLEAFKYATVVFLSIIFWVVILLQIWFLIMAIVRLVTGKWKLMIIWYLPIIAGIVLGMLYILSVDQITSEPGFQGTITVSSIIFLSFGIGKIRKVWSTLMCADKDKK